MKYYSPEAVAAIEKGEVIISGAVEILCDPPIRVWGGYGNLNIGGVDFDPIGDQGLAIISGAAIGGTAQNLNLQLSGIEPDVLALLDANEVKRAPVNFYSLIFDGTGTEMLHAGVHQRGRIDRLPVEETAGGTATITAIVESPGRGLGRRTGRRRTDADQRLIKANDGGMRLISFAAEKKLYWGGKRPSSAGAVLGGGSSRKEPGLNYSLQ